MDRIQEQLFKIQTAGVGNHYTKSEKQPSSQKCGKTAGVDDTASAIKEPGRLSQQGKSVNNLLTAENGANYLPTSKLQSA